MRAGRRLCRPRARSTSAIRRARKAGVVVSATRSPASRTARRIGRDADWMVDRTTTLLAAVQLFQPGRQLQPEVLFARPVRQDRARAALPRRITGRVPTPAHVRRSDAAMSEHIRPQGEGGRSRASDRLSCGHPACSLSRLAPEADARGGRNTVASRRSPCAIAEPSPSSTRRPRPTPAATPAGRRPTCGWPRSIASSRRSSTTCWRRPISRATRTISRRSPRRRPPRAMDRRARRAVPSAGLLSGEGPAAHPARRRRRDHPSRVDPRRARGRRRVPLRLRGRGADRRTRRGRRRAGSPPARRCQPTPSSSPAAASRPTPR